MQTSSLSCLAGIQDRGFAFPWCPTPASPSPGLRPFSFAMQSCTRTRMCALFFDGAALCLRPCGAITSTAAQRIVVCDGNATAMKSYCARSARCQRVEQAAWRGGCVVCVHLLIQPCLCADCCPLLSSQVRSRGEDGVREVAHLPICMPPSHTTWRSTAE